MITIKLSAFEGPFDLLYHLIEKNKIDIYDIPISELTDQYLEYIKNLPQEDMDSLSRFLYMAATLLEIKSKMLLPGRWLEDEEDSLDPREALVARLIEYKRFKKVSGVLEEKAMDGEKYFYKIPEKDILPILEQMKSEENLLEGISLDRLFQVFQDVLRRKELKIDRIRHGFDTVRKDNYTIEEKLDHLCNLLKKKRRISFTRVLMEAECRAEQVVTFLALLELIKEKKIRIKQGDLFDDILISRVEA